MPSTVRIVISTIEGKENARKLAREIVDRKLAACVNMIPGIKSIYWWQDEIVESDEILLVMKTSERTLDQLVSTLEQLHPYDTPEIIAAEPGFVAERYARWVENSTVA